MGAGALKLATTGLLLHSAEIANNSFDGVHLLFGELQQGKLRLRNNFGP